MAKDVAKSLQFFGSTVTRFQETESELEAIAVPPPGKYEEIRSALKIDVQTSDLAPDRKPFGQSAARFPRPHHVRYTPGPVYNTESWQAGAAGVQASMRATVNLAAKAGFGTSAARKDPFLVRPAKASAPAPSA